MAGRTGVLSAAGRHGSTLNKNTAKSTIKPTRTLGDTISGEVTVEQTWNLDKHIIQQGISPILICSTSNYRRSIHITVNSASSYRTPCPGKVVQVDESYFARKAKAKSVTESFQSLIFCVVISCSSPSSALYIIMRSW